MRKIVAGNWKMHKDRSEALALVSALGRSPAIAGVEVMVAPAFPFLAMAAELLQGTDIIVAGQNCHHEAKGAYTGEVSAPMLQSVGVKACIVGHSERRQYFAESDEMIGRKVRILLDHGITPIFCCGESRSEREAGSHFKVVTEQMKGALGGLTPEQMEQVVVAYEPVWAIGTGLTATAGQAQEMHAHIRSLLRSHGPNVANVPVLYGGSCKPDNAAELFAGPDVNGGLIGGAALDAEQFTMLIRIAGES
ncbi:MAG: triose-phosphate isomerase [Flavobacteriales bacterium]|nr:triose-phosphate isomerase [Flavobacteriales bacterium]